MIRYLTGEIIAINRNQLTLATSGGVGYGVSVPSRTLAVSPIGTKLSVHISEAIREDAHDLFGFETTEERDLFEGLRKASGVGPKVALAMLSHFSPAILRQIILDGDIARLSLVPGIGQRSASKIIVELRGQFDGDISIPMTDRSRDAIEVVKSLGYNPREIEVALRNMPADLSTTEEQVTWLLRSLAS